MFCHFLIRATNDIFFDFFLAEGLRDEFADLSGKREDLDFVSRQKFFSDGSGGHTAYGFAGTGASAPSIVAEAVFLVVGEIGVTGSVQVFDQFVFGGIGVAVFDHHRQGCAGGFAVEDAGQESYLIRLLAGGGDFALSGPSAVEFDLNVFFRKRQAGRTAVHYDANAGAMRFAPSGYSE